MDEGADVYELSIELDEEEHAAELRTELRRRGFDVEALDGEPKLTVDLLGFRPEQRIEEVLSTVEAWLRTGGPSAVRVNVDGMSYRLNAPGPAA